MLKCSNTICVLVHPNAKKVIMSLTSKMSLNRVNNNYGGVAVLSGKGCDRDTGHVSSSLFYPDFELDFFRDIVHPFLQFSIFPGFKLLLNLEFGF